MKTHMRLDIKGCILNQTFDGFTSDTGRPLSRKEAHLKLLDTLSEGKKYLPVGKCNNWSDQEGCLGHED